MSTLLDQILGFVRSRTYLSVGIFAGSALGILAFLTRSGILRLPSSRPQQRITATQVPQTTANLTIDEEPRSSPDKEFLELLVRFRDQTHTSPEKLAEDLQVIASKVNQKPLTTVIYTTVGEKLLELLDKYKVQNSEITADITHILASCFHDAKAREAFPEHNLLNFVDALSNTNENVVFSALKAIMNLACLSKYEGLTRHYNGIIPIINLIKNSNTSDRIRYQAIRTLVNLVYDHQNKQIVVKEDLVDDLVRLLRRKPDGEMASRIIRVLGFLADRTNLDTYRQVVNQEVIALISEVLRDNRASTPEIQENLLLITSVFITKIFRDTSEPQIDRDERDAIQSSLRAWYADEPDHYVIRLLLSALISPQSNRSSSNSVLNSLLALFNLSTGAGAERVAATIRNSPLYPNIKQCAETSSVEKIKAKARDLAGVVRGPDFVSNEATV
eukprot:TRINITY_DN7450_c0_g1_i2.p1 TRINITY_DN7450_c0_g1~~TRINITY_DN7450_c0_g1_i2.p1  ORF type:complete len:445 (-),score=71.56 TRINITY_DN7450_c0_g1_i2:62-1396(-)